MTDLLQEIKELKELLFISQKQVFDSDEAAKYLTISKDSLLRYVRIGQIAYVKNGRNYIFKKEFLDTWLDKNKVGVS